MLPGSTAAITKTHRERIADGDRVCLAQDSTDGRPRPPVRRGTVFQPFCGMIPAAGIPVRRRSVCVVPPQSMCVCFFPHG